MATKTGVAKRLKDRFAGKEQEILQCVRIHGSISAMYRYDVADYVCWARYIDKLRTQFASGESRGEVSPTDDKKINVFGTSVLPTYNSPIVVNVPNDRLFLGNCPNRKSLADELVEAFTQKIVNLSAENARLRAENEELKGKILYLEDKDDDSFSARIIQSIEVIKRC